MEPTGEDFGRFRDMGDGNFIPNPVREFLKEFYAALSHGRPQEITTIYQRGWRDLSKKFFSENPWPEPEDIGPYVHDDPTFITLYKLLYYRHLLMRLPSPERPARMSEFAEAWEAYRELFNMVLGAVEEDHSGSHSMLNPKNLSLPPIWAYDMLDEFLYHFQTFHERRNKRAIQIAEGEESEEENAAAESAAVGGQLEVDMDDEDLCEVWRTEEVISYLYKLVDATNIRQKLQDGKKVVKTHKSGLKTSSSFIPSSFPDLMGYFSLLMLLRLHAKLADYGSALECASWIDLGAEAFFARVSKAHLTMYYYYGFSLLMARRYTDAAALFSRILSFFHRTAHLLSGDASTTTNMSSFMQRQANKMLALISIPLALSDYAGGKVDARTLAMLPGMDEVVVQRVVSKHGDRMSTIANAARTPIPFSVIRKVARVQLSSDKEERQTQLNEALSGLSAEMRSTLAAAIEAITGTFKQAGPGFISPAVSMDFPADNEKIAHRQMALFLEEVLSRAIALPTLRSYMRLYTSIDTNKLAAFLGMPESVIPELLLALKIKDWQRQGVAISAESANAASSDAGDQQPTHEDKDAKSAEHTTFCGTPSHSFASSDLLHFYVDTDMVNVEETKRSGDASRFFARSVLEFSQMRKDVENAMQRERALKEKAPTSNVQRISAVKVSSAKPGRTGGSSSSSGFASFRR